MAKLELTVRSMLTFFLFRLVIVSAALYLGVGIGNLLYGYFVNHTPLGKDIIEIFNPIGLWAALSLPLFIPLLSMRLIWGGTIASAAVCIFWTKSPWWLVLLPFITAVCLGYKIVDVWRVG